MREFFVSVPFFTALHRRPWIFLWKKKKTWSDRLDTADFELPGELSLSDPAKGRVLVPCSGSGRVVGLSGSFHVSLK